MFSTTTHVTDQTAYIYDCPVCHFYKNAACDPGDPCRRKGCSGVVERVDFVRVSALQELVTKWNKGSGYVYALTEAEAEYYTGQDTAYESAADALTELFPQEV